MKHPRLPKPDDGVAWITGGSSGIGRALALRLARAGWTVIISARHDKALGDVAASDPHKHIHGVAVDVTDEAAIARAVGEIEQRFGAIALAILNGGTYREVTAANFRAADFRAHVEVNIMGVVHCLEALLPHMRQRKLGQIAITGSVAGYRGLYRSGAYGLTKAGLINMAEALAPELEREGICLQICNPGFVATPLTAGNPFPMPQLMTAEAAAEAYYRGLMGGRFEIAFPWRFVFTLKVLRALPYALALPLLRRLGPKGDQP
jgi:NAD(P)-dependent dehydrogenase (short-subunit alcohol dehydrogenase family)